MENSTETRSGSSMKCIIREAGPEHRQFLASAIVEADCSGTSRSAYAALFQLNDAELYDLFLRIFELDLEDCEYALSAFCVAETEGRAVAACAAWMEEENSIPSWQYKLSALRAALSPDSFSHLLSLQAQVSGIMPARTAGAVQMESVFILPEFRGQGLFQQMLQHQKSRFEGRNSAPELMQIISYDNNETAIRAYQKAGFREKLKTKIDSAFVKAHYPSCGMVLMELNF